jgi:hypothetical protein
MMDSVTITSVNELLQVAEEIFRSTDTSKMVVSGSTRLYLGPSAKDSPRIPAPTTGLVKPYPEMIA